MLTRTNIGTAKSHPALHTMAAQAFLNVVPSAEGMLFAESPNWICVLAGTLQCDHLADQVTSQLNSLEFPRIDVGQLESHSDSIGPPMPIELDDPKPAKRLIAQGFTIEDRRYACVWNAPCRQAGFKQNEIENKQKAVPKEISQRARAIAAADWVASFLHDVCQPIGVSHNIMEMILLQEKANRENDATIQTLSSTLSAAMEKAKTLLAGIKLQFGEIDATQEDVDVWDAFNDYFHRSHLQSAFLLGGKRAAVKIRVHVEYLMALLDCIVELFAVSSTAENVRVDIVQEQGKAHITFNDAVSLPPGGIHDTKGNNLLIAALWHSCETITRAQGGEIFLAESSSDLETPYSQIRISIPSSTGDWVTRKIRKIW